MKILYALQGTGNGHKARALEFVPILQKRGEIDIVVSGHESQISFPFPIFKHYRGLTFKMNKVGGIDFLKSILGFHFIQFLVDVWKCPVKEYDLVLNDFEPVVAWACLLKGVPCIGFSHQAALTFKQTPKADKGKLIGRFLLKYYAPTALSYGFHFKQYHRRIHKPIIRTQIKELIPRKKGFYLVYLPAYEVDSIVKLLSYFPDKEWKIFSPRISKKSNLENIGIYPIDQKRYLNALKDCSGVICGAGFELPSEALFLKKKLLVVPIKNQYEQLCNAEALKLLGVPVMENLSNHNIELIRNWMDQQNTIDIEVETNPNFIIDRLILRHMIFLKNSLNPSLT